VELLAQLSAYIARAVEKGNKNLNPPDEEEVFMSMMSKLEATHKEGKIKEFYFKAKKNIEKLKTYEKRKRGY
jgi:hypothetical protein